MKEPQSWGTPRGHLVKGQEICELIKEFVEKAMAPHSLAWRMPGMAEPGGLLSMGPHRVRHD